MKVIYDRDRGDLYRINRGDGWNSYARHCRAAHRVRGAASRRFLDDRGFRPIIRIRIRDRRLE